MVELTLPIVLQILQTAGIFVGIVYYITIMRNSQRTRELTLRAQEQAVETRQAQLFMQLNDRWQLMNWAKIMPHVSTKISGWKELNERMESDPEFKQTISDLGSFYEYLGVIVKEGYLSIRLVALMWAGVTRTFWENITEPMLEEMREKTGYPRGWSETEYLCRELIKYMDEHPELKT